MNTPITIEAATIEHKKMPLIVIEEFQADGSVIWYLSFTDPNPEAKDCFPMIDAKTAFRLKAYLTENAPISFNPPVRLPTDEL